MDVIRLKESPDFESPKVSRELARNDNDSSLLNGSFNSNIGKFVSQLKAMVQMRFQLTVGLAHV